MSRRIALGAGAAVALAAGAAGLATAGSGSSGADARFLPGSARAGAGGGLSQAPEATCDQWRAGSAEQRAQAVRDIDAAFAKRLPGGRARGATLPVEEAVAVLDRACAESVAGPWRLWKIYEHALAFQYRAP